MMSTSGSVGAGAGSPSAIFGGPPGMSPGASSPPAMGLSLGASAGARGAPVGRSDPLEGTGGAGVGAFGDTSLALTDRSHAETKLSNEEEQLLQQRLEELGKADQTWVYELASVFRGIRNNKTTSRQRLRCGAATCFVILLLLGINLIGNSLSQSYVASEKGALVKPSGLVPVATSKLVELHDILEYAAMPIDKLRRVEDVVFTHRGIVHFFKIASFRKYSDSHLILVSPERSIITIKDGAVKFTIPFETEQYVEEAQPAELRAAFNFQTYDPSLTPPPEKSET